MFAVGQTVDAQQPAQSRQKADSAFTEQKIDVAYGDVTKRNSTYSISTVRSEDIINTSVYLSGNALFGKLPGLTVIQRTSEPGNDSPTFYLRGRSTTKTNTPLIIVDGIERDINDIQLNDIESVSVLKDAASSIIYGIKGANGVILVTTKRGKEQSLVIKGSVEQNFMTPTREPKFYDSYNFVQLYNQALVNDGLAPQYTQAQIDGYKNGNPYFYPNIDWRKEVTNNFAFGTKANFNVTGGEKNAKYYASVGYFHQGGLYKNTDMNEGYSTNLGINNIFFKSNLDITMNKNWTVSLDINGRVNQKNSPSTGTATVWDMIYKYPAHLFPVYVQDGVYGGTAIYPNNPVGYINSKGYRATNNRIIYTTLSTKYDLGDLLPGLSAGMKFAYDNLYSNQEGYTRSFAVRELLGMDASGNPVLSPLIGTNTNLETLADNGYPYSDVQNKRNTFEGNIQYKPQLGAGHSLNTQIIYHQDRLVIGSESPYNYQFIAGRVNYGYLKRYFAEVGASYSGTEAFPKGHRFGFFPAASAGWVISEEGFLKNNKAINFLKLYVSAGIVGNSAVGERFSDLSQYITGTSYNFGSANASQGGLSSGVLPNPDFTWETAYKYDVGVSLRVFDALDVDATYFFQKRKDILVPESNIVSGIIGADLPNFNAGITHNSGFELSLGYAKNKGKWGYHAGLNVSYVTDKIQYFPEAVQPYSYLYKTGHPVNQPFMLEAIGFFNSDADIQSSPVQTFGNVKPGDIKYKDQNGDGKIDSFDEIPLYHSTLPTCDLGFDLGFNFKGFDISAFFQGQLGRSLYLGNEPFLFWPLTNDGGRITSYAKQFWTPQTAATADYPRLTTIENANNYRESSFWYVNGNFVRLRTLDIGYTIPAKMVKRARMSKARVFVRGTNVFTLDHLKYTDPEVMSGYPVMKSYNVGFSVQF